MLTFAAHYSLKSPSAEAIETLRRQVEIFSPACEPEYFSLMQKERWAQDFDLLDWHDPRLGKFIAARIVVFPGSVALRTAHPTALIHARTILEPILSGLVSEGVNQPPYP